MKFRKKPVVVEAVQLTRDFWWEGYDFCETAIREWDFNREKDEECYLVIRTLEGRMKVSLNDWIIKGVKGEFYPCKPDIFERTYEHVEGGT